MKGFISSLIASIEEAEREIGQDVLNGCCTELEKTRTSLSIQRDDEFRSDVREFYGL